MSGRRWISLLSVLAAATVAASCGSSPVELVVAPPAPTPGPNSFCAFHWVVEEGNGAIDWYAVEIAGTEWKSGPTALGATAIAYYVLGYDPSSMLFDAAGMTTSGEITLTTSGMNEGAKATFLDLGGKSFFDATGVLGGFEDTLGPRVATGGAGNFDGSLSATDPATPVRNGAGSIALRYEDGTAALFGGAASGVVQYAYCMP
jgi:hypothetical protein